MTKLIKKQIMARYYRIFFLFFVFYDAFVCYFLIF